ncbi:MAG: pyridoxal phosphate-dependent aminotransferase [Myxococcales bacterium]|nr:pyridoxal phosphate-dependent aminotransferase [Myxococcales bacterium]
MCRDWFPPPSPSPSTQTTKEESNAMSIHLASRLDRVKPSITLAVSQKAADMRAQGVDIISFGAGEPDFETPTHIKDAAIEGLSQGASKYPAVGGITKLRAAICATTEAVHGFQVSPDQVLVSAGAKHSLFNLFLALLNPGDEVIVPAPYWVSYPEMVRLVGAEAVCLKAHPEKGFALDMDELRAAINDKTRAIVLNSPSNPTGAIYSRELLQNIADLCVEKDILVIADDIYRQLVYGDGEYVSIASLGEEIAKRTILIDGVSKSYAMTGWRIGWTVGPKEVIKGMTKIQGQSTSGANHLAQIAATEALVGPQGCVGEMRDAFDARRKRMVELLNGIDGVRCQEPKGAFYAFPDVSSFIGKSGASGDTMTDDVVLAGYLVEKGVALVPGSGFGCPGFVRLSYASSMEDIDEGLARMKAALEELE